MSTRTIDDVVIPFALDTRPVRGRIVRLGAVLDDILAAHDYPEPVARLLGEAVLIAVLAGSSLKFEGRLIIQASGDGPVSLVLADYSTNGGIRGYARFDAAALAGLEEKTPDLGQLMGKGRFALTIDPGGASERYQGVVALEGAGLGVSALSYFATSEQVPTRLSLSMARLTDAAGKKSWRGGGAIMQMIAGQSQNDEDWDHASALFETISADELTDPNVSAETLLFRLFHEEEVRGASPNRNTRSYSERQHRDSAIKMVGVRVFEPTILHKRCPCTPDYLRSVLAQFPAGEHKGMTEEDGRIRMTCAFCSKDFFFTPEEISST